LFGLLVGFINKGTIERDLEQRSIAALKSAGIKWAKPEFKGLEGTIKGEAPSKGARLKAIEIVQGVWGVRSVADQLSIQKIVSPYVFKTFHGKEKLVLEGYVPSEKIRQSVISASKAQFSNVALVDKLKIARGAPDPSKWFGQVSYALGHLARMKDGHFILSDLNLNIAGTALDTSTFKSLNETFAAPLPLQMTAGKIEIQPPLVENYNFASSFKALEVTISGVMPNEASIKKLMSTAKTYFPGANINSNIEQGSGAPKAWEKAILLSLAELSKLEEGEVSLQKQTVKITGLATSKVQAQAIRKTVRSAYPTGYKVTDKIKVKEPIIPIAFPFEFKANHTNGVITLSGVVESQKQKQEILDLIKSEYPDNQIVDQLAIARGAPENFLQSVLAGLKLLKSIDKAEILLINDQLTLQGQSTDETLVNSLDQKPVNLPENYTWVNGVKFDNSKKLAEEAARKAKEEAERLAAEKAEQERLAAEKAEQERLAAEKAKAEAEKKAKEEEEKKKAREKAEAEEKEAAKNITSKEELEKRKSWLSREQTAKRLEEMHKESGAVNAKECQLLMNSLVRGNAIRFSVNSSVINPNSYDILSKVHTVADRCTNTVIRVEGHTDKDGTDIYNLELSKRRAQSVVNHLVKLGIPSDRLDTKGFGEKKPVASNNTSAGKALNRRIEFVVFEN
jgi:outer membrane protein OmpA-like peptidoglycan-associated protein